MPLEVQVGLVSRARIQLQREQNAVNCCLLLSLGTTRQAQGRDLAADVQETSMYAGKRW